MSVGIYIDPPARSLHGDRFLRPTTGRLHSSLTRCLQFVKSTFEARGIAVHTADLLPPPSRTDRYLYVSVNNYQNHARLARRPDVVLSAYLVMESPVVEPRVYRDLPAARRGFNRIYSCIDQNDITEFTGAPVDCSPLRWPVDFHGVDEELWTRSDRGFLVMINMNKLPALPQHELFTERMRAVESFGASGDIDLYGVGWHQASLRLGRSRLPVAVQRARIRFRNWRDRHWPDPLLVAARKVYRGELETKWETLAGYDFVLCFENTALGGWLTEKLFEALRVGTIPVYWGATDIEKLVPPECFIDMRQFDDYVDLHRFLRSLDRAAVRRYREAGRRFLESADFEPWSRDTFLGMFERMVEEDAGVPAPA